MWTPIILTDQPTNRKVHCTIFERELFNSHVIDFEWLWEMYKDDLTVQLMNNMEVIQ